VGNAVLDVVLAEGFLARVSEAAGRLRQRLEGLVASNPDILEEVRGEGLMLGLKCKVPNGDFVNRAREAGLLLVPAGDNVARLLPPLIIADAEIDEAARLLETTCAASRAAAA
jgi:acetylornithine/N-succinyldiaminopimelate aminotransferase